LKTVKITPYQRVALGWNLGRIALQKCRVGCSKAYKNTNLLLVKK